MASPREEVPSKKESAWEKKFFRSKLNLRDEQEGNDQEGEGKISRKSFKKMKYYPVKCCQLISNSISHGIW